MITLKMYPILQLQLSHLTLINVLKDTKKEKICQNGSQPLCRVAVMPVHHLTSVLFARMKKLGSSVIVLYCIYMLYINIFYWNCNNCFCTSGQEHWHIFFLVYILDFSVRHDTMKQSHFFCTFTLTSYNIIYNIHSPIALLGTTC